MKTIKTENKPIICEHELATRAIFYTDTVEGKQALRDDLWAVSTEELNKEAAIRTELLAALNAVQGVIAAKGAELDGGADYHAVAADLMTRMAHMSHRIGDAIAKAEGK